MPFVWHEGKEEYVKAPTGCTAVAIAQTLYFTHHKINTPSGLFHDVSLTGYKRDEKNYSFRFSRDNYVENSPRWAQMPLTAYGMNSQYASYVADLMADVGDRVGMKYNYDGSSAHITHEALHSFGLNFDKKDYTYEDVLAELKSGMPVMVTAYANTKTTGWWIWKETYPVDGHAWVIDGLKEQTDTYEYEYIWVYDSSSQKGRDIHILYPDNSHPYSSDIHPYNQVPKELFDKYEEVLTIEEAERRGIYEGDRETSLYDHRKEPFISMNWGWSGLYDAWYSPYTYSSWNVDEDDYKHKREIYYKIRRL